MKQTLQLSKMLLACCFATNLSAQPMAAISVTPTNHTNIMTVNPGIPMSTVPNLMVQVPSAGDFYILGRGTMGVNTTTTTAFCKLSLHKGATQLFEGVGLASLNTTGSAAIQHIATLAATDVLELKYSSDFAAPVAFGYKGDNISLLKISGPRAQSATPTTHTNITSVSPNIPMNANPSISVNAPSTGNYLILGKGTMGVATTTTTAFCKLSLHKNTSTSLFESTAFTSLNTTSSSIIQHIAALNASDVVELKYSTDLNAPAAFGYPGDNVILLGITDVSAESTTPTAHTNISTVNPGIPMSANPKITVTAPASGKYLIIGRGTMGVATTTSAAFCKLYLYKNTSSQLFEGTAFTSKNNTEGSFVQHLADLNANDVVELQFSSDLAAPAAFGYPGDNIILIKYDHLTRVYENPFQINSVQASPNPFKNKISISYSLNNGSDVFSEITDLNGRVVKKLFTGHQSAGHHRLEADLGDSEIAEGIYIIKVTSGIYTMQYKVAKQ